MNTLRRLARILGFGSHFGVDPDEVARVRAAITAAHDAVERAEKARGPIRSENKGLGRRRALRYAARLQRQRPARTRPRRVPPKVLALCVAWSHRPPKTRRQAVTYFVRPLLALRRKGA